MDKQPWVDRIEAQCTALAALLNVTDAKGKSEIRHILFGLAREQYVDGNRAGINWMREQLAKQGITTAFNQK